MNDRTADRGNTGSIAKEIVNPEDKKAFEKWEKENKEMIHKQQQKLNTMTDELGKDMLKRLTKMFHNRGTIGYRATPEIAFLIGETAELQARLANVVESFFDMTRLLQGEIEGIKNEMTILDDIKN